MNTTIMRLAIYFLPLILCLNAHAQKIKVTESAKQDWSGGVAGKRGSNYNFTLEFQRSKDSIIADTIWIENEPIAIVTGTEDIFGRNCFITKSGGEVSLHINVGISRDDHTLAYGYMEQKEEVKAEAPIKYKGVALLSYRYNGKRCYYVISKLTLMRDPINYP
jgi:hypothetical protein